MVLIAWKMCLGIFERNYFLYANNYYILNYLCMLGKNINFCFSIQHSVQSNAITNSNICCCCSFFISKLYFKPIQVCQTVGLLNL